MWLPGHTGPVLAGQLRRRPTSAGYGDADVYEFAYSTTYPARTDAISLFPPELPLRRGWLEPLDAMTMPGCLRDGSPDSWGSICGRRRSLA